jgi:hypothetical protein
MSFKIPWVTFGILVVPIVWITVAIFAQRLARDLGLPFEPAYFDNLLILMVLATACWALSMTDRIPGWKPIWLLVLSTVVLTYAATPLVIVVMA